MIKWIICLFLSHDFNFEKKRLSQTWLWEEVGKPDIERMQYWCKRCNRFINV